MGYVQFLLVLCTALVLIHVARGQCSGTALPLSASSLTTSQTVTLPTTPYANNLECEWLLEASSSYKIFLSVDSIYLEWNYDFLTIYDGNSTSSPTLFFSQDDRTSNKILLSSGNTMKVRFTSDHSIASNGFTLTFIAVDRTNMHYCYSTITANTTEAQLSYVTNYDVGCPYYIYVGATSRIQYRVPVSEYGLFHVMDGTGVTLNAGTSVYVSTGNSLTIYITYQLVMNFKEVSNTATASLVTTTPVADFSICNVNSLMAGSTDQYITSPNYPANYPNNEYCLVTITASTSGAAVKLEFVDWDMDYTDYLYIYDGPSSSYNLLGTWWPTSSTSNSTGASLYLVFISDSIGTLRGFRAKYTESTREIPSCALSYTQYSATTSLANITSPGYPLDYTNYMDEYWLIVKPLETDNLVLDIIVMDIEEAYNCSYDRLTIYDGSCTTDPVLAAVCGTTPVTFEDSTGLYILVRFTTDISVTQSGFVLQYYIDDIVKADENQFRTEWVGQEYERLQYANSQINGTFTDDDDTFEIKDWIIPLGILMGVIAIIIGAALFVFVKRYRDMRVVGVKKADTSSTSRPKLARKLTTHQLLEQFKTQYKNKQRGSRQKPEFEPLPSHLPPNPPGPNTVILSRSDVTPHPPPQPPGTDPAYPPNIFGNDTVMPAPIAPALPPGQKPQPSAPLLMPIENTPGVIPPPFRYISPAEARAAAEAQSGIQPTPR